MTQVSVPRTNVLIIEDHDLVQRMYQHRFATDSRIHAQVVADARRAKGWLIEHPDTAVIVVSTSKLEQKKISQATLDLIELLREVSGGQNRTVRFILANSDSNALVAYRGVTDRERTHVVADGHKEHVYDAVLKALGLQPFVSDVAC